MRPVLLFLLMAISTIGTATAQKSVGLKNEKDSVELKKPQNKIFLNPGVTYISNLTYAGRKNAVGVQVLTPYFNVISKKGAFLSATGYINTSPGSRAMDGMSVTPGYVFTLSKHFNGFVSGTKYFLTDSSSLIFSSMKASIDAGMNFTPKLINAGLTFDYLIGTKQDFIAGTNISKDIKTTVFKKAALKLSPTVSFQAGTQSFYETYYTNTITRRRVPAGGSSNSGPLGGILGGGSSNPDSTIVTSIITEKSQREVRQFRPLNINFSIPLNLHVGKFMLDIDPNLVFPFSQVNFNERQSSIHLNKPFFFYTAGMSMIF